MLHRSLAGRLIGSGSGGGIEWTRSVPAAGLKLFQQGLQAGCGASPAGGAPSGLGSTASQQPCPAALLASLHTVAALPWLPAAASTAPSGGGSACSRRQQAHGAGALPRLPRRPQSSHRAFHPGSCSMRAPAAASLGVVDQLHEVTAIVLPATGRRNFWEVGGGVPVRRWGCVGGWGVRGGGVCGGVRGCRLRLATCRCSLPVLHCAQQRMKGPVAP